MTVEDDLRAALAADGFVVDVGHLAIFGQCADCATAGPAAPPT